EKLPLSTRLAMVGEVYSVVVDAKRASRVDIFNGNYGLMRGLSAAILVLLIASAATARGLPVAAALVLALLLALQRMHRFSRHYARELFVQFVAAARKPSG